MIFNSVLYLNLCRVLQKEYLRRSYVVVVETITIALSSLPLLLVLLFTIIMSFFTTVIYKVDVLSVQQLSKRVQISASYVPFIFAIVCMRKT